MCGSAKLKDDRNFFKSRATNFSFQIWRVKKIFFLLLIESQKWKQNRAKLHFSKILFCYVNQCAHQPNFKMIVIASNYRLQIFYIRFDNSKQIFCLLVRQYQKSKQNVPKLLCLKILFCHDKQCAHKSNWKMTVSFSNHELQIVPFRFEKLTKSSFC